MGINDIALQVVTNPRFVTVNSLLNVGYSLCSHQSEVRHNRRQAVQTGRGPSPVLTGPPPR